MELDHLMHDAKFWVGVSFVIFMALFFKYGMKFVTKGLDERGQKISDELAQAKRLREEAAEVLASYKKREAEALKDAKELLTHARAEADRLKIQAEQSLKENVERRITQANEKIARAESEAIETIRAQIVDTAITAVKKVIVEQLASDGKDPSVQAAISQISRIVH